MFLLMEETLSNYPPSVRWHHSTADIIIFFPPGSRTLNMKLSQIFAILREWGFGPYWQTMNILVDEINGYTVTFNTQYQPPTYEMLQAMNKPPVVELFEWPDRYFVEAKSKDYWARWFDGEIAPHLVDLSVPCCDCEDFQRNVIQARKYGSKRKVCSHILAAFDEKDRLTQQLTKNPPTE